MNTTCFCNLKKIGITAALAAIAILFAGCTDENRSTANPVEIQVEINAQNLRLIDNGRNTIGITIGASQLGSIPELGSGDTITVPIEIGEIGGDVVSRLKIRKDGGNFGAIPTEGISITISTTATSKTITLHATTDGADDTENDSFTVRIGTPTSTGKLAAANNYSIKVVSASGTTLPDNKKLTVTVLDSDKPTIGFTMSSYLTLENGNSITIDAEIKHSRLLPGVTTIIASTVDGNAEASKDYISTTKTLSFSSMAPINIQDSIVIPIIMDNIAEGTEYFNVVLGFPEGSSLSDEIILDPMVAQIAISDDQVLGIGFVNAPYEVSEGDGRASVAIGILDEGVVLPDGMILTFSYIISDGTASAGTDYQNVSGTVTLENARRTQEIFIPITDDSLVEENESFDVKIFSIVGVSLRGVPIPGPDQPPVSFSPTPVTVTIIDNDRATTPTD